MNQHITSQPIVVLTGAGASVALGKATTFQVYDTPEFQHFASGNPVKALMNLRNSIRGALVAAAFEVGGPFSILAIGPEVDKKAIAATLTVPAAHVYTAKMNFEPTNISSLLERIGARLKSAPARKRRRRQ